MTLVRAFNPFNSFAPTVNVRHFDGLDRLFNDFFADDFSVKNRAATPSVNVSENDQFFTLAVVAPGFAKENFKIQVEKNVLTISGEVKVETKTEGDDAPKADKILRHEFRISSFKRQFTLPENVDATAIKAAYDNGILTVQLPKIEKQNSVQAIEIQ
ncbi:MAG: Hsp20/alpha crystallin family protein [Saprospiraceae bacterium]|nr:Hsp20/alpha crystallin family protein [Saprospiraceae bacterium]